jgi:hypothetical protein
MAVGVAFEVSTKTLSPVTGERVIADGNVF